MLHLLLVKGPISSLEGFYLLNVVKGLEPMVSAREAHSSESKSGLAFARYQRNNFLKKAFKLDGYLTRDWKRRKRTLVLAST